MPRPCDHVGQKPVPTCRVCELYALRPDYRRLWQEGDIWLDFAQLPASVSKEQRQAGKLRVGIADLAKKRH